MKKSKVFSTRVIAEIAIFSAIAFALDFLQGGIFRGLFPNGGSIGFAMLPIILISYRRGFLPGLLCGFVVSFLQMLGGFYAVADAWYMVLLQIMLDYVIAYPMVSFCGLLSKKYKQAELTKNRIILLIIGCFIGGILKLLCHYLAGVIFWSSSCPEGFLGGPAVFSLVYNGGYMLPNIIINCLVMILICIKQPEFIIPKENLVEVKEKN